MTQRTPNVHFWRAPALQTPPKFNEKTSREITWSAILRGRKKKKKKREMLGSHPSGPTLRDPTQWDRTSAILPQMKCWPFWGSLFSRCFCPYDNFLLFWPSSPLTLQKKSRTIRRVMQKEVPEKLVWVKERNTLCRLSGCPSLSMQRRRPPATLNRNAVPPQSQVSGFRLCRGC